jgi:hypothetical protein
VEWIAELADEIEAARGGKKKDQQNGPLEEGELSTCLANRTRLVSSDGILWPESNTFNCGHPAQLRSI